MSKSKNFDSSIERLHGSENVTPADELSDEVAHTVYKQLQSLERDHRRGMLDVVARKYNVNIPSLRKKMREMGIEFEDTPASISHESVRKLPFDMRLQLDLSLVGRKKSGALDAMCTRFPKVGDLQGKTHQEILKTPGMGPVSLQKIIKELQQIGIQWTEDGRLLNSTQENKHS